MDYLPVIYKHLWMILALAFLAMGATVISSLRQPRMYQASTSIVPPTSSQQGGLASQLVGGVGGVGSSLLQGMLRQGSPSGLYVGILESRAVSDALIDRFDLMKVYKTDRKFVAQKTLQENTSIKASKDGIVRVSIIDRDPNMAAAIANAYVAELDQQNKRLSSGQATSKRIFLENRLKEIQNELSKIENLQSREVQIKEMLFEMFAQQCELAKIEEAKSMPTIQVLDPAVAPELGIARGTVKKGISAGIAAFMLGIFLVFVREYVAGVRASSGK